LRKLDGRRERVNVPSAIGEPAVKPIEEGCRVRNRDIEASGRFQDSMDLRQAAIHVPDVLKAVVGHDRIECVCGERERRRIAADEARWRGRSSFEIQPDHRCPQAGCVKASVSAA
jgi:hypothetical protein